jgi:hypothetical protein
VAPRSTSKLSPEQQLKGAIMLMERVFAQLLPVEQQRLQSARAWLEARRPLPREAVLMLQQDYMRLRGAQMQLITAVEDASPHLFPEELETVHAAHITLESGQFASDDLMTRLGNIRLRVSLPQILEGLENQSPLLSDVENGLVQQALLSVNVTGAVPPKLQQKILKLQQNLVLRQHLGMG